MSSLANRRAKAYLATSSERELARRLLVAPNPGDIMMVLIFGWALFCFYLVTVGESALVRIARLARSDGIQELLLSSSQGLGGPDGYRMYCFGRNHCCCRQISAPVFAWIPVRHDIRKCQLEAAP